MRYFFESKVEKKEKGYMIQIPFNVWEVCKQRDVIKAEVVLDNNVIDCELLPLEKGNYEIHIDDDDAVSVELGVPHKVLLQYPNCYRFPRLPQNPLHFWKLQYCRTRPI